MDRTYYIHLRRLHDPDNGISNQIAIEWRPEIDLLMLFINNMLACIDFQGKAIPENTPPQPRWDNITTLAVNKHIMIVSITADESMLNVLNNTFNDDRPPPPYGFEYDEYISTVREHRQWLIDRLTNLDSNFQSADIESYISSFVFSNEIYQSIQNWMIGVFGGDYGTLYPDQLVIQGQWRISQIKQLFDAWVMEFPDADINKMFQAFEIYTMNCILEVA